MSQITRLIGSPGDEVRYHYLKLSEVTQIASYGSACRIFSKMEPDGFWIGLTMSEVCERLVNCRDMECEDTPAD